MEVEIKAVHIVDTVHKMDDKSKFRNAGQHFSFYYYGTAVQLPYNNIYTNR